MEVNQPLVGQQEEDRNSELSSEDSGRSEGDMRQTEPAQPLEDSQLSDDINVRRRQKILGRGEERLLGILTSREASGLRMRRPPLDISATELNQCNISEHIPEVNIPIIKRERNPSAKKIWPMPYPLIIAVSACIVKLMHFIALYTLECDECASYLLTFIVMECYDLSQTHLNQPHELAVYFPRWKKILIVIIFFSSVFQSIFLHFAIYFVSLALLQCLFP